MRFKSRAQRWIFRRLCLKSLPVAMGALIATACHAQVNASPPPDAAQTAATDAPDPELDPDEEAPPAQEPTPPQEQVAAADEPPADEPPADELPADEEAPAEEQVAEEGATGPTGQSGMPGPAGSPPPPAPWTAADSQRLFREAGWNPETGWPLTPAQQRAQERAGAQAGSSDPQGDRNQAINDWALGLAQGSGSGSGRLDLHLDRPCAAATCTAWERSWRTKMATTTSSSRRTGPGGKSWKGPKSCYKCKSPMRDKRMDVPLYVDDEHHRAMVTARECTACGETLISGPEIERATAEIRAAANFSGHLRVRMPPVLHKALAASAKEHGRSLNQELIELLEAALKPSK